MVLDSIFSVTVSIRDHQRIAYSSWVSISTFPLHMIISKCFWWAHRSVRSHFEAAESKSIATSWLELEVVWVCCRAALLQLHSIQFDHNTRRKVNFQHFSRMRAALTCFRRKKITLSEQRKWGKLILTETYQKNSFNLLSCLHLENKHNFSTAERKSETFSFWENLKSIGING